MQIVRVEIFVLNIPMADALMVSFGKINELKPIIIKMTDELGAIGYGESILLPYPMTPFEYFDTGLVTLKNFLVPAIIGKEIALSDSAYTAIENFMDLYKHIHGFEMTKSGMQNAFIHLMTQRYNISIYDLFETKNPTVHVGASIGIPQDVDDYLGKINAFVKRGVQRIKLKIARGKDSALISKVRGEFPDIEFDDGCELGLGFQIFSEFSATHGWVKY